MGSGTVDRSWWVELGTSDSQWDRGQIMVNGTVGPLSNGGPILYIRRLLNLYLKTWNSP